MTVRRGEEQMVLGRNDEGYSEADGYQLRAFA